MEIQGKLKEQGPRETEKPKKAKPAGTFGRKPI
jgi:hypothetical protein